MMCGSVPQIAIARTLQSTSWWPGTGRSTSSIENTFGSCDDERPHVIATGSTIEPVAPRIASGSATNRNSRTPARASSSRSRLSRM